jgi:hypothetical protein
MVDPELQIKQDEVGGFISNDEGVCTFPPHLDPHYPIWISKI